MNFKIKDDIIDLIVNKCNGHLRDAHMLLDEYTLLGEQKFKELAQSSQDLYYKLILSSLMNKLENIPKIIELLQCFPLYSLKNDYEQAVLNIIKSGLKVQISDNAYINAIIKLFNERIFMLIDVLNDKRIFDMFTSDKRFQAAMYIISSNLMKLMKK